MRQLQTHGSREPSDVIELARSRTGSRPKDADNGRLRQEYPYHRGNTDRLPQRRNSTERARASHLRLNERSLQAAKEMLGAEVSPFARTQQSPDLDTMFATIKRGSAPGRPSS